MENLFENEQFLRMAELKRKQSESAAELRPSYPEEIQVRILFNAL